MVCFQFFYILSSTKKKKASGKACDIAASFSTSFFEVLLILKAYFVKLGGRIELDQNHKTALGVKIRNCCVKSNS